MMLVTVRQFRLVAGTANGTAADIDTPEQSYEGLHHRLGSFSLI
jgi:hypothetical protein